MRIPSFPPLYASHNHHHQSILSEQESPEGTQQVHFLKLSFAFSPLSGATAHFLSYLFTSSILILASLSSVVFLVLPGRAGDYFPSSLGLYMHIVVFIGDSDGLVAGPSSFPHAW